MPFVSLPKVKLLYRGGFRLLLRILDFGLRILDCSLQILDLSCNILDCGLEEVERR
jgi:hypothetical protein